MRLYNAKKAECVDHKPNSMLRSPSKLKKLMGGISVDEEVWFPDSLDKDSPQLIIQWLKRSEVG
eukprot:5026306-Amphidinium_carterae.1